jgi:hypothetical protein
MHNVSTSCYSSLCNTLLVLKFHLRWMPMSNSKSMLECDAHVYSYQWHLVCLHSLSLLFMPYYHLVCKRGRSSETHDPWSYFSHKSFLCYLYVISFQFLCTPKITKYCLLILFCFINLQAIGAWKTLQLVGNAKLLFFCCRFVWRVCRKNHVFYPWEFDINSRVSLVGKTSLAASLSA